MGDAAVAVAQPAEAPKAEPASETPKPATATRNDDVKTDIRAKLTENLRKESRKREREESKAKAPKPVKAEAPAPAVPVADPKTPKVPPKEPPQSEARPAPKDPKANPPKDAAKTEDGQPDEQPAVEGEPDEVKAFQARKRDFAKFQRKKEREYAERDARYADRDAHFAEREQSLNAREQTLRQDIRRDPMAALRALGVDVKKEIMSWVDEDSEDPKDKRLRELDERTRRAEEKLTEREQAEKAERQRAARGRVTATLSSFFETVEPDDYPHLYEGYDAAEIGNIAADVVLKHYAETGQKLAPERVFAYLEGVEREDAERRNARRQTIGSKRGPESREQVPPVESASPERRSRASSDVTNRATRIGVNNGSAGRLKGEALREHLIDMARDALHR